MIKRGQITAYFIIALVVAATFLILGTAKKDNASKLDVGMENVRVDDSNLRAFVESCVNTAAKNAVFYLGFVGGNLKDDIFKQYYPIGTIYKIPYYYYEGASLILTEDGFKNLVLAKYMNDNLRKCTNNFKAFENARIVDSNVKTNVELSGNEAIFNVRYPVSINHGFSVKNLDPDYIAVVRVRLKDILQIAQNIVENEVKNGRHINWDYLTEVSKRNYNITAYTENDNTLVYRIIDLENEIDKEPYVFQWANKIKFKGD